MMSICIALGIIVTAIIARLAIMRLFTREEKQSGGHSDWTIIGKGWGVYDREYVEASYDI